MPYPSIASPYLPDFYPCYSVLLPDGTYRKFKNAWVFFSEEQTVAYEELTYTGMYGDDWYYRVNGYGSDESRFIEGLDYNAFNPNRDFPYCDTAEGSYSYSEYRFYPCLTVNAPYTEPKTYVSVWAAHCFQIIYGFARGENSTTLTDTLFIEDDEKAKIIFIKDVNNNQTYSIVNDKFVRKTNITGSSKPAPRPGFTEYEFKSTFSVKAANKLYKKFKNVWVATPIKDDGGVKSKIALRLITECSPLLLKKVPHFTTIDRTIPNLDPLEVYNNAESELHDSIASFSKNNANMWMKRLDSGFVNVNVADTILLR